jgi:hypothetical protein
VVEVEKPADSPLTIAAYLHDAVMRLPPEQRLNRVSVNEACASPILMGNDDGDLRTYWHATSVKPSRRSLTATMIVDRQFSAKPVGAPLRHSAAAHIEGLSTLVAPACSSQTRMPCRVLRVIDEMPVQIG